MLSTNLAVESGGGKRKNSIRVLPILAVVGAAIFSFFH